MNDVYSFLDKSLYKLTPQKEAGSSVVDPSNIDSGLSTGFSEMVSGGIKQGKHGFDNTETGFILGIENELAKFYIGNTTNYLNWTGTELVISGNISATTGFFGISPNGVSVASNGLILSGSGVIATASSGERVVMQKTVGDSSNNGLFVYDSSNYLKFRASGQNTTSLYVAAQGGMAAQFFGGNLSGDTVSLGSNASSADSGRSGAELHISQTDQYHGEGILIELLQSSGAYPLTDGNAIKINNEGTGKDILGTSSTWSISKTGVFTGHASEIKFGGDGSDGALAISSGTTTIDCDGAQLVVLQYTSVSITGTGKLAFSNKHANGTIVIIKSQGNVTLTSSTIPNIDCSGMGASGGNMGLTENTFHFATDGKTGIAIADDSSHHGLTDANKTNNLDEYRAGAGGAVCTNAYLYTRYSYLLSRHGIVLACGSGGAGGNAAALKGGGATSQGGNGGAGGGGLIIECGGLWNFTSALGISVAGTDGVDSPDISYSASTAGGGGGGGGSGGFCVVLYNELTENTGTINSKGGDGGDGGTATGTYNQGAPISGGGGGGGGSIGGAGGNGGVGNNTENAGANGSNGGGARAGGGGGGGGVSNVGGGSTQAGGTGGTGGDSENVLVSKNYFF